MTSRQRQLIETFIRMEVRKSLNEAPENRDLEYLYKLLKVYAKKINKPLRNVVVNGNRNDSDFQDLLEIEKSWNNFIFGISDYYHKRKSK